MATIYQVAQLAGVSVATVSRVLNHHNSVSDKTAHKVQQAMQQLGYRPNAMAQSLASNRSNSVGLMVSELHGPFFGSMMSGIEQQLRQAGKHVVITAGHSNEVDEKKGIEFLIGRNCDALILHVEAVSDQFLIELSQHKVPIILINRDIAQLCDTCISLNNEQGGYLATSYLINLGHRQFGYIAGPLWKQDAIDRLNGHRRALSEAGLEFNEQLVFEGDYQESGGATGMQHFLTQGLTLTAVVCANDEMAAGAMGVMHDKGLQIPQDISIVGFDNVTLAQFLHPKLTTISYPIYEMGIMAAKLVLKQSYQQQHLEVNNQFQTALIKRNSTAIIKSTPVNPALIS